MKKQSWLFSLFLLTEIPYLLGTGRAVQQSAVQFSSIDAKSLSNPKRKWLIDGYCNGYNLPREICFVIRYFVYDNPLRYRNQLLPNDLSGQDLSGFDFTKCHFTHTNLSNANLTGIILANTTCDYQKAFQENIKKNNLRDGDWYQENLPKDLQSIAKVYPQLNNNVHKTVLLQIASAFSRLPFYEETEFYTQVAYWSSEFIQLKKRLGSSYSQQLVCTLQHGLEHDADNHCWTTKYPQGRVSINGQAPHANFKAYLEDFTNGLIKYQCQSKDSDSFFWYKQEIIRSIEGVASTYPYIEEAALQQESRDIAHALSKSYQVGQLIFLHHYLLLQSRLILFKKSVEEKAKDKVYYSLDTIPRAPQAWRKEEK